MTKKIILIEPDGLFINSFKNKLEGQRLDKDFEVLQIDPTAFGLEDSNLMINGCIDKIRDLLVSEDIHSIFIDISFNDEINDRLGIKVAAILKNNHPLIPIFCITNKTRSEVDYSNFCHATLEAIEGVFIKRFLTDKEFSKEDFNIVFEKANKKIQLRQPSIENLHTETFDIAVITALQFELDTFTNMLSSEKIAIPQSKLIINDSTLYNKLNLQCSQNILKIVCATEDRMGMPSITSLASRMIINFRPKYIFIIGIAAGIKGDIKIGDILVANQAWDYGSGKLKLEENGLKDDKGNAILVDTFIPYGDHIQLDETLRNSFVKYKSNEVFLMKTGDTFSEYTYDLKFPQLHIGPFASGAAVIANENKVLSLKQMEGKLIGFDMEVYGVFAAARTLQTFGNHTKPIAIKSVSDFGDSHKNNPNKELYQRYAAHTSASFLKNYLINEF